ncbi:MAG: hypothetical protein OXU27_07880 [Candidatus Poribacteria bacterium]|nr:hypothetical protein [Candidatus Poribacteria bacterium]MDE0326131.1 hypothetical protein [Candidatus Poribacteria bacterium]
MEDKNTEEDQRTSLFTVRSAEVAVLTFAMLTLGYLIIGMLYQKNLMGKSWVETLVSVYKNGPTFIANATIFILFEEGIDIMFIRLRESLKRDKRLISKGRAEAYQEAYQEMQAAWEQRRREAEAKGIEFNEPRPEPPKNKQS